MPPTISPNDAGPPHIQRSLNDLLVKIFLALAVPGTLGLWYLATTLATQTALLGQHGSEISDLNTAVKLSATDRAQWEHMIGQKIEDIRVNVARISPTKFGELEAPTVLDVGK